MILRIIRHADPDYAIDGLTERGHKEAEALGQLAQSWDLDFLYASTMGRAQLTAGYISAQTGLEVQSEPWTRELDEWQIDMPGGEHVFPWSYPGEHIPHLREGIASAYSEDFWLKNEKLAGYHQSLVEQSDEFFRGHGYERQGGLYHQISDEVNSRQLAVVCHGGFGMAWLAHLLQLPLAVAWAVMWLPPSSVTTVLFEHRSADIAVPRCIGMGETAHLYKADMKMKPSGLYGNMI